ncbi:hypothetical protein V1503_21060 [Bacillus sp. SCS-151]|uniref:hypothetical protein n=1 Tax=Nanhaiella sioensis TaxID=3115293 RepID=UPI00397CF74F
MNTISQQKILDVIKIDFNLIQFYAIISSFQKGNNVDTPQNEESGGSNGIFCFTKLLLTFLLNILHSSAI